MATNLKVMALNDTKAGMTGLDKEKINQIIEEASRGSKYYESRARSQSRITDRVQNMQRKLRNLTPEEIDRAKTEVDSTISSMIDTSNRDRILVHVDMDAYYAAVEIRDDPIKLKGRPMAVGSSKMLSTSSYEARKYGVRAGMPGFIARKLCPELIIVPPNFEKYREIATQIRQIFAEYDPNFCPMSLDEAYLDITNAINSSNSPDAVVQEMRSRIFEKTGLTASAGIASNSMLAKVCSDQRKPNGQFYLKNESIPDFIKTLPIRKVGGIGNVTEQLLAGLEIETCSDLYEKLAVVKLLFSESSFYFFARVSLGLGSTQITDSTDRERKSMSNETTFALDCSDPDSLFKVCRDLSDDLSADLIDEGFRGRTVTLKIKTDSFVVRTRAITLLNACNDAETIYNAASKALKWFLSDSSLKLRLMGVRMSDLNKEDDDSQTTLRKYFRSENKAEPLNQVECPKCNLRISPVYINSHLDSCLRNNETKTTKTTTKCPICNKVYHPLSDSDSSHIDDCLSRKKIAEILKSTNNFFTKSKSRKTKTIEVYFRK